MITLRGATAAGVTLPEALNAARLPDGAVALLTTPSAYRVARVEGGVCVTPSGPADLSPAYEARVFTPDVELRWTETGAVLLAEDPALLPSAFGRPIDPLDAITTLSASYLLWGTVSSPTTGTWATLTSARVGPLTVPLPRDTPSPEPATRISLATREYVAADPEHGNAYVAEERLIRFEPYKQKPCPEEKAKK